MKQLEIISRAMHLLDGSFINYNNELIMIPKFNVYTMLDNVETETDFKVKLCEWFSRDCCCAIHYSSPKMRIKYWNDNTAIFNDLCKTKFTVAEMEFIYTYLGNGIKHKLCIEFVESGFDLSAILEATK